MKKEGELKLVGTGKGTKRRLTYKPNHEFTPSSPDRHHRQDNFLNTK